MGSLGILIKFINLFFVSFGALTFIIVLVDIIRKMRRPKQNHNKIYMLCERYINLYDSGDGYWLTDTEIQLYKELEKQLKCLKVIK